MTATNYYCRIMDTTLHFNKFMKVGRYGYWKRLYCLLCRHVYLCDRNDVSRTEKAWTQHTRFRAYRLSSLHGLAAVSGGNTRVHEPVPKAGRALFGTFLTIRMRKRDRFGI